MCDAFLAIALLSLNTRQSNMKGVASIQSNPIPIMFFVTFFYGAAFPMTRT